MDISRVLREYPDLVQQHSWRLFDKPGFSGAALWQGMLHDIPRLALKHWPKSTDARRLHFQLQEQDAASSSGLRFVPAIIPTRSGQLAALTMGCHWTLSNWLPGEANYCQAPSRAKLLNAILAVAELHRFWRGRLLTVRPCPVVAERLAMLNEELPSRLELVHTITEPFRELLLSLLNLCEAIIPRLREELGRFIAVPVELHTCLRDIWHDHLLFTGDQLTGLVDFGEVQSSNPLADLARLLGDLEPLGGEPWQDALNCYESTMRKRIDGQFIWTLHRAGMVGAVRHWLRQAASWQIPERLSNRVAARLNRLLDSLMATADSRFGFHDPTLSRPGFSRLQ